MNGMAKKMNGARRPHGLASVLAIGTANPENCFNQDEFPDLCFRVTKSEHLTGLKEKFKRICERSTVRKRYLHLTEEILQEYPSIATYNAPSLDARQEIEVAEVPKLAARAASKAIEEWGQPKSKITHLIFCSTSGIDKPGVDCHLVHLLGLPLSVNRVMLYTLGCHAGGTVLRIAKDLAENNVGSRVLVVCTELTVMTFRGPSETDLANLIRMAIFGDGAAAVIIGADPDLSIERPIFEIYSASQTLVPNTSKAIHGRVLEMGLTFYVDKMVPTLVASNIEQCLDKAFSPIGIKDWNSIFWMPHPGGPAILAEIEAKLGLKPEKLRATKHVLSEYGNMSSATVLFILDEMRRRSKKEGKETTGEGLEWGVLMGFGPGVTVETVVLRAISV
ncbi:hypothetical protein K2173_000481 [Erythroxylum novogranatense]|uniref:Chalcone synthase n=1 Tax=Erythroxylum novogranatense TaxID=1862640 RepID=A0AAV8SXN4_9ROSI|nr:Chain A, EnPKS2 [Erythroxylum novogranatense]7F0E_B Chain B, EnPKS2 [Erythroxylum novogranatense]7F0E_C Chain C, EnPKS2 [Erythroxylum novogranatense]7F0E_D Chain D, EnPKS2 [Erythroxylum novogranatense]KAJ8758760.1 hypothetical protein K2173_000481 [Erythroxylum novogranatense]UUG60324.1 type III PKS [Erythroxylum novogranatense]